MKRELYKTVVISKSDTTEFEPSGKCKISALYPKIFLPNNQVLEKKINEKFRLCFISDIESYCTESSTITTDVSMTFKEHRNSLGLLSISSHIIISGEISAILIEGYNIDLNTGEFLTKLELIDENFHKELNALLVSKFDSRPEYQLENFFINSQIVFSGENAIFYLPQVGMLGPFEEKIKISEILPFINKKYL